MADVRTVQAGAGPAGGRGLMTKLGLPRELGPGLWALALFGIGSTVCMSWISQYFTARGFSMNQVGDIMAVLGVASALGGWFGGALADKWGPRPVVASGAVIWLVTMSAFLLLGTRSGFWGVLVTFGLTGLSALFPFAFMSWVSYSVPKEKLGLAMGLFWMTMAFGMPLSAFYSAAARPALGDIPVIATGLPLVLAALVLALLTTGSSRRAGEGPGLGAALLLAVRKPAVGVVGVVRVINTLGMMGLMVYLPVWFTKDLGLPASAAPTVLGALTFVNLVCNVVFGALGDRMGYKRAITWFGCVGGFVTLLLLFYVPQWLGPNLPALVLAGALFGAALAAFVPLSALGPALAPEASGSAVAVLSLGQGVSQFLGSGLGGWLYDAGGASLATWVLALCYLAGAGLMALVPDPRAGAGRQPSGTAV